MKYLKLFPLMAFIALVSCNMGPSTEYYTGVVVSIDEKTIPETASVGEPFSIYAHSSLGTACWSNIRFCFDTLDENIFRLYALADYYSEGGDCPEMVVSGDTSITLTTDLEGEYIITTWVNAYKYELDTITVGEFVDE